jgi:hypothetical protein
MKRARIMQKSLILILSLFVAGFAMQVQAFEKINVSDSIKPYKGYEVPASAEQSKYQYKGKSALLSANTPVKISNDEIISAGNLQNGSTVHYTVTENVRALDGTIVIPAGTPVLATVTNIKEKGRIGKPGEMTIANFKTRAVDGSEITLSAFVTKKADNRMARSIVLSAVVFPAFLLMRGADAEIPKGTPQTAYTVRDINIPAN